MGIPELEAEWLAHDIVGETKEWDDLREESAPLYRQALDDFLARSADVPAFRTRIDSLSKSHGYGLLDTSQPALYTAYGSRMRELKERLGTTTWGVEHLLWRLGKGASEPEVPAVEATADATKPAEAAGIDLYASYRAQGLHFPDEVVTSLVLSLATKRFVILSGISGTGKTQIALGLARHLESGSDEEPVEVEPPAGDTSNVYIRMTAPKLQRSRTTLDAATRATIEARLGLPERGTSKRFTARLPNGSMGSLRLNNLGFTDPTRQLFLLFFLKDTGAWLADHARPGDLLHLHLAPQDDADLSGASALSVGEVRG